MKLQAQLAGRRPAARGRWRGPAGDTSVPSFHAEPRSGRRKAACSRAPVRPGEGAALVSVTCWVQPAPVLPPG